MTVLDLFSAAAGGWSLGMHRAGFTTVAACEREEWRRILYAENNPGVRLYDDVCTLTAGRLVADLRALPDIIVGSPPCQDISSANTKGKGVDGERSGLFFEAIRIIGEVRPRWFALENSANLRTRGADRVVDALAKLGYTCWPFVVGVGDGKIAAGIGGNNERARSWLIGCDLAQIADPYSHPVRLAELSRGPEPQASVPLYAACDASEDRRGSGLPGGPPGPTAEPEQPTCWNALDAAGLGHEGRRSWGRGSDGDGSSPTPKGNDADAAQERPEGLAGRPWRGRAGEVAECPDLPAGCEVGLRPSDRLAALQHRPDWSLDDLARHIRLDDGLPAWVAGARVAVGGPRGTSAASLIVEAFGDSVCPQIPEAIGRAILRTEAALAAVYSEAA